jgi:EAL and modified HD-GYP domain-containing signal transduction protein
MGLAMTHKENPPSSYILGLFSQMDAMMDMPMPEIMKNLPFSDDVKTALCEVHSNTDLALQLRICIAFERADWAVIYEMSQKANIPEADLFQMYYDSVHWANAMQAQVAESN